MTVIITEKPSVAKEISGCVGATTRRNGYFEGNGYSVTWLYGHVLEMYAPGEHKTWSLDCLPIMPARFEYREISDCSEQIGRIRELLSACDSAILATDAGREGEVLGRELLDYLDFRKPFRRLWISSLTEEAIREGLKRENLRDGRSPEFNNLYRAGLMRAEADWLVGINATRALTLVADIPNTVLSLGRVQTPTLCMICDRYNQFINFRPEAFWFLRGKSVKDGVEFGYRTPGRYMDKQTAEEARAAVMKSPIVTVREVKTERKTEMPPLPLDLGTLQKQANTRYGFTMDHVLSLAQSLYEKKLITYPRTGCRYIPKDVFRTIPQIMEKFHNHPVYGQAARDLYGKKLNDRCVNDTKLTDHHALLVTGRSPEGLTEEELKIYDLVLVRFIEAFSPVCVADITHVTLSAGGITFETRGRKDISPGWRGVCAEERPEEVALEDVDDVEKDTGPLPTMKAGDVIPVASVQLIEDTTKPTPLYTDATLITAMEKAGNSVDDKEGSKALKGVGIGTVATRADIVATLEKRKYIERKGKQKTKKIMPTRLGMMVYSTVHDKAIANVAMTAQWEITLQAMAEGRADSDSFRSRIRSYTRSLISDLTSGNAVKDIRQVVEDMSIKCPKCGKTLLLTEKSAWCKGCNYTIWRKVAGKTLADNIIEKLVNKGETGLMTGFKNKEGKSFDAYLVLERDTGKISLRLPKYKKF